MKKYAPFWQDFSVKVSYTQVTVRACGALVKDYMINFMNRILFCFTSELYLHCFGYMDNVL